MVAVGLVNLARFGVLGLQNSRCATNAERSLIM
jgi:hypothetical protein